MEEKEKEKKDDLQTCGWIAAGKKHSNSLDEITLETSGSQTCIAQKTIEIFSRAIELTPWPLGREEKATLAILQLPLQYGQPVLDLLRDLGELLVRLGSDGFVERSIKLNGMKNISA